MNSPRKKLAFKKLWFWFLYENKVFKKKIRTKKYSTLAQYKISEEYELDKHEKLLCKKFYGKFKTATEYIHSDLKK